MIPLPSGTKIWLVAGISDMRNGFNGLAAKVQTTLKDDPMSGHVFIFRGRNGSQVKLLWSTGDGLYLRQSGTTSGVAAMDYDWDGAVDVLVTKQSGSVYLIRNTNTVSYGTSLHLRITDPNGINVYYGNTVKLYNSAGVLVATQIINPQSGMGVNDTSALVNFYGLNAGETYNAVLIKSTGTTASNIDQTVNTSWGGLQATDATHAYDLSAEAGTS